MMSIRIRSSNQNYFSSFHALCAWYLRCYYKLNIAGHSHKRRRTSEHGIDIEDRLESLITRVGEKVKEMCKL